MKQHHPTTVEQGVKITLELEPFLGPRQRIVQLEEALVAQVSAKQQQDALLEAMPDIVGRLEKLEAKMQGSSSHASASKYTRRGRKQKTNGEPHNTKPKSLGPIFCHKCH